MISKKLLYSMGGGGRGGARSGFSFPMTAHDFGGAFHIADQIADVNTKLSDGDMITTLPGEIGTYFATKASPVPADFLLIEDTDAALAKKKITIASLAIPLSPVLLKCEKITISHVDFQTAGLTKTNNLWSLPAGATVFSARLKASAAFLGGAISNYFVSLGITGSLQDIMTEYDALNIVVGNTEYAESFALQSFDYNAAVDLKVTARSVTANLSASTQGSALVEIYYIVKA